MSPLSLDQRLTAHELEDERRHGQTQSQLTRIEGKIDLLSAQVLEARRVAEDAEDAAEATGSHLINDARNRASFWVKVIAGIVSALTVAGVSGLVTYFVTHR